MAMDRAVGMPDNTRTGTGYIPEKYATKIQALFYRDTFLNRITNTEYEGEIKKGGDTVVIPVQPTISTFVHGIGRTISYQVPSSTPVIMSIDKCRGWAFSSDDIEEAQSPLDYVPTWITHASRQMREDIESDFLSDVYTGVSTYNAGATAGRISGNVNLGVSGTPVQVSSSTIVNKLTDLNLVLDEINAPKEGRYVMLPPKIAQLVKQSPLAYANQSGDRTALMRTGVIGMVDGLEILQSNMVYKVTDGSNAVYNCLFGHKMAISFATQIEGRPERLRDKDSTQTYNRGFMVYGYKVVKAEGVGNLYAYV